MKIDVNNRSVEIIEGETLLDLLTRNGIKIPTLCHMKDFSPTGACRMCLVEDQKSGKLITSCSHPAEEGMQILTHSQKVVEARKVIVELLLSNHPNDCLYCTRNKMCELQDLSEELNVRERKLGEHKNHQFKDMSSPSIVRDPAKCILCGRCISVCDQTMGVSAIDFTHRGSNSRVGTTFNKGLNTSSCVNCGQCITVCPTGALTEQDHLTELMDALSDPQKKVVVQYAPAITVSIAEAFNLDQSSDLSEKLNGALRHMGFDFVFDTCFTADLTIMEESAELIQRITGNGVLPMITSCCPAWVKYAEEFAEEFLPNISSCKSPQQMMGAIIKSYFAEQIQSTASQIYSVSIMPCTAKKFEAQRPEMITNGISDVDAVLTTRELIKMIRLFGLDLNSVKPEPADSPLGARTSAGKIFGATGGVMEAALRTAHFTLTGEELMDPVIPVLRGLDPWKEAHIKINGVDIGIAVVNGLANAGKLLQQIRNGRDDLHFIEVMACPGGCISGGGQIIGTSKEKKQTRMNTLYEIDEKEEIKVSHKNPEVIELYHKFLIEPLGSVSHHHLHTVYEKREVVL